MYRKIALASLALNVAFVVGTAFFFVPWLLTILRNLKVEPPLPVMWLINTSHFLTNPQTLIPTLLLVLSVFGVRALRKPRASAA